jgi:hypothetical protein
MTRKNLFSSIFRGVVAAVAAPVIAAQSAVAPMALVEGVAGTLGETYFVDGESFEMGADVFIGNAERYAMAE